MTTIPNTGQLRVALVVDAAMSGASGLLLAAATGPVVQATALPAGLLAACGWFFLAYAGALAWLARRAAVPGRVVGVLAGGNLAWAGGGGPGGGQPWPGGGAASRCLRWAWCRPRASASRCLRRRGWR